MAMANANSNPMRWTSLQGQYLAFIYAYTTIHGQAPAERDLQKFFRTTAPSVHNMIKSLDQRGFIRRQPGVARSIQLLVPPNELPILQRPE
jgi:DNA-binding MarR family transcriptional regulator